MVDSQDFAVAVAMNTNRNKHRYVLQLTAPVALEPDAIEHHVRMLTIKRASSLRFDLLIDLLVHLADGAGTDSGAPQRLGDVFDTAHRHTG